jgi:hypothetical protein
LPTSTRDELSIEKPHNDVVLPRTSHEGCLALAALSKERLSLDDFRGGKPLVMAETENVRGAFP